MKFSEKGQRNMKAKDLKNFILEFTKDCEKEYIVIAENDFIAVMESSDELNNKLAKKNGNMELSEGKSLLYMQFKKDNESSGKYRIYYGEHKGFSKHKNFIKLNTVNKSKLGISEISLKEVYLSKNPILGRFAKQVIYQAALTEIQLDMLRKLFTAPATGLILSMAVKTDELEETAKTETENLSTLQAALRIFYDDSFVKLCKHMQEITVPFVTEDYKKFNSFYSMIKDVYTFFGEDKLPLKIFPMYLLKKFFERYGINPKDKDSVNLFYISRVEMGTLLSYIETISDTRTSEEDLFNIFMIIWRKGRWNDFMEKRRHYHKTFEHIESVKDSKEHDVTVKLMSEIIDNISKESLYRSLALVIDGMIGKGDGDDKEN